MEPLEVYGQEKTRELIERSVRSGTFANSVLFEGPEGVGKERMAFWLAQLLLCNEGSGCGHCNPCSKIIRLTHPDLKWMIPAPGGESSASESDGERSHGRKLTEREKFIAEAMDIKRTEPFFVPRSNRPLGHSADSLRELLDWCSKQPFEAERKIVIIRDADMMAPGIANMFLKLLEEPPLDTVIILTSAMPHRLLSTVLSRCISYRFPAVDDSHTIDALKEYRGVEGERAALYAGLAQGSLVRALEFADEEDGVRQEALRIFGVAAVGRVRECYDILLSSLSGGYGRGRADTLDRILFFMVIVLRDLLVLIGGSDKGSVVNVDLLERMKKLVGKWDRLRIAELVLELERIRRDLRYNINVDLAMWRILDSVRTNLHEGRSRQWRKSYQQTIDTTFLS